MAPMMVIGQEMTNPMTNAQSLRGASSTVGSIPGPGCAGVVDLVARWWQNDAESVLIGQQKRGYFCHWTIASIM